MNEPKPAGDYQFLLDHAEHRALSRTYNPDREQSDYGLFGPLVDLDAEEA